MQRIDWKVYGRTDNLYVREFEQETNLRGYLFLDASRSMDFGPGPGTNSSTAVCYVRCWACCCAASSGQLAVFGRGASIPIEDWWPPSTRRDHLEHLVHHLETSVADGPHDHLGGLADLVDECHRRSLAAIITDALVDPGELKDMLGRLRMRGTKVILFHLLAREELEPPSTMRWCWLIARPKPNAQWTARSMPDCMRKTWPASAQTSNKSATIRKPNTVSCPRTNPWMRPSAVSSC